MLIQPMGTKTQVGMWWKRNTEFGLAEIDDEERVGRFHVFATTTCFCL
jgi:hypothetical protein